MIVRPRPSAFALLFILRASIVGIIAPRLATVTLLSAAIAGLHAAMPNRALDLTPAPFTLFGLALSIFLGFRNNACYDRWWEGRRHWGQLIAEARGFARDAIAVLPDDMDTTRRIVRRAVGFAYALRDQLRGTDDGGLRAWLDADDWPAVERARSRPDVILLAIIAELRTLLAIGALRDIPYSILSERLMAMTTIQTACERLRSTPPPFTYTLLLHRTAWLFCLLLPFGLVGTLGFATPLLTVILAYAFFGLDALGDELEEPFGLAQNALPLDAMVRAIEIAVGEALGDDELPLPLQPKGFILR